MTKITSVRTGKNKPDYIHSIEKYKLSTTNQIANCLVIEDLNLGNMSVTNGIEIVLTEIAQLEKINPKDYIAVYKDSQSLWNVYCQNDNDFYAIDMLTWYEAIEVYIIRKTIL